MEYQLWCFFCVIHWAITTQICYMFIWIFHRCNALGSSGLPPSRWLLRCAVSRPELNIAVTCLVFYISVGARTTNRRCPPTYRWGALRSTLRPIGRTKTHLYTHHDGHCSSALTFHKHSSLEQSDLTPEQQGLHMIDEMSMWKCKWLSHFCVFVIFHKKYDQLIHVIASYLICRFNQL